MIMVGGEVFDAEFIKTLGGLGVGGAIAGLIFVFYRKDIRQYTDLWQKMAEREEARAIALAEREDKRTDALMQLVKENTAATTTNSEVLRALHRRVDSLDLLRIVDHGIELTDPPQQQQGEARRQIEGSRRRST